MTVRIDEARVFEIIEAKKPKVVLVNAPGGLLRQTKELMERVKERYGVTSILSGDSCFGICDTVDDDVEKLQADLALHIGHNAAVTAVGTPPIWLTRWTTSSLARLSMSQQRLWPHTDG